jgi:LmbE family N-acetylglucosaminyl deacetylase
MVRKILSIVLVSLCLFTNSLVAQPQSPRTLDAAELRIAIKKLSVLGSVLFIAAHPDDENTAFLAYMAKGRLMRSAYLAVTRGEGGQNLLGAEQGDLMGIIRTQELLAARRIDGAEQYFTRAIDFGYSKTLDETMRIWGRERILSDVVWVIRSYRPDVVVMRFTPTQGGHGNHTSSAALAEEAYAAAGDPLCFPEQLRFVQIWKPKRLLWNVFRFQQSDRPARPDSAVAIDLGLYSPALGESFTEIAGRSRSMHKSQGFGAGQNRGEFVNYFQHVAGEMAVADVFDGVNTTWSRVVGGGGAAKLLEDAYRTFDVENPAKSLPVLLRAYGEIEKLNEDPWTQVKKRELVDIIKLCGGLWLDALSSDNYGVPGGEIKITGTALNRSSYPFRLTRIVGPFGRFDTTLNVQLQGNQPVQTVFTLKLPKDLPYSQPYWLVEPAELGAYRIPRQELVGQPENVPALTVSMTLVSNDGAMTFEVPVRYRSVDPVEGEQYRPFAIIPPVALNLPERTYVFPDNKPRSVQVNLRSNVPLGTSTVSLRTPDGWKVTPPSIPLELKQKDENLSLDFLVEPTSRSGSGSFGVEATVGDARVHQDMITIRYPHIPPQTVFPVAEGRLLRVDLKKTERRIGYIMGAGDDIPAALRQLGYHVTLLTDDDLKNGGLNQYDVIIAGVRAYNTRPVLKANQRKLMEFVEKGGTYVVQYMTARRTETENLGPYPFNVTSDRVSVEGAPMRFLAPNHAVLNTPNKITQADFDGWVQERGLYFADKWDPHYTAVLASNDPGEPSRDGGLLVAQYGKGTYVFTGYAFFRQLPAGVPGAYRLFVNLISLGGLR